MKLLIKLLVALTLIVALVPAMTVNAQAYETLKPTAYTFSSNGTNVNPGYAYDFGIGGEDTSYNRLGVGDNNSDPTIEYHTWQTPGNSHTARRLYIRRSGTGNSDDTWGIYYSTDGGSSYSAIETGLTDPTKGNATIYIDSGLDLSNLQVKIVTTLSGGSDGGYADIWDVWLEGDYTDISNGPGSHAFGTLGESDSYQTGFTHFTVTNNSANPVNITIGGSDMTGGVTWTLSDDSTPGADIYGLRAGLEGAGSYTIIVKRSGPSNTLVSNLASLGTQQWGLELLSPTSFSDGAQKSGTVTLTATQA